MTPRLVFRPQAESEILEARNWYEERRQGLGEAFAAVVDLTVAGILEHPLAYPRIYGETRRAIMRRFPYAVYFRVLSEENCSPGCNTRPPSRSPLANATLRAMQAWRLRPHGTRTSLIPTKKQSEYHHLLFGSFGSVASQPLWSVLSRAAERRPGARV